MIRQKIKNLVEKAVKELQKEGVFPEFEMPEIGIETPENKNFGDYATNISFKIAKLTGKNLSDVTERLTMKIVSLSPSHFGNKTGLYPIHADHLSGFINISIPEPCLYEELTEILEKKEKYKSEELKKIGNGKKVNVEFISANPTGPLTLGNGRGGFCGDVLANILEEVGFEVTKEYYINDVGEQITALGHSVLKDNEMVYAGDYIGFLNSLFDKESKGGQFALFQLDPRDKSDIDDPQKNKDPRWVGEFAAKYILKDMIKPSVEKMGIKFDVWFSEKSLYQNKEVDKIIDFLKKEDLTYEKEGAIWFKSTKFGDDKDRVLVKSDGEKTYFASDIAYLKNKLERGFDRLIFFWGADHFGYIDRIKAATEALGYKKEQLDIIIMQLVAIKWGGERLRMSKREGVYRTIDELIEGLKLDVVRFLFLTQSPTSPMLFDLDIAQQQSEKNPAYYIQYAYARICSILRKSQIKKLKSNNLELLEESAELALIKQLIRLPEIIEDTADDYQVQRVPQYALDLVRTFHRFYEECRVIDEKNPDLTQARLALVGAAQIVLKNTLDLMGISAPEKM